MPNCPKCNVALVYYDGCLGYESLVCPICHYDIQDDQIVIPTLRHNERQGDLLSTQTEPFALVGEQGIDHATRQEQAEQSEQDRAESDLLQERLL